MLEVSLITCVVLPLKVACVTPNQMIHRLSYYASWHLSIEVNPLPLGEQGVLIMQIVVGIQACRYLFVFVGYFAPMSMKMSGKLIKFCGFLGFIGSQRQFLLRWKLVFGPQPQSSKRHRILQVNNSAC